jgi:hypothetical protein
MGAGPAFRRHNPQSGCPILRVLFAKGGRRSDRTIEPCTFKPRGLKTTPIKKCQGGFRYPRQESVAFLSQTGRYLPELTREGING